MRTFLDDINCTSTKIIAKVKERPHYTGNLPMLTT